MVTRGWRIAKEKQSHKIDVVVALAQAALGAVKQGQEYITCTGYQAAPKVRGGHLFHEAAGSSRETAEAAEAAGKLS